LRRSFEAVVDLYQCFGSKFVEWLESVQSSDLSNAQNTLAGSALNLLHRRSAVAFPFLNCCKIFLNHLLEPTRHAADHNEVVRLGEKLSAIAIFLFHISTAGSVRGTQAIQLKLFNEAFQSSMDLDSMRNVYIYQG
jgi:hypothetical protein